MAVKLIQLYQNNQGFSGGDLADPNVDVDLRPAFFEGVTGVSAQPAVQSTATVAPVPGTPSRPRAPSTTVTAPSTPAPTGQQQPQQQQATSPVTAQHNVQHQQVQPQPPQPNLTLATQDPYTMVPAENSRYQALFPQYQNADGYVYGKEAVELFTKSGLDQGTLRTIWNMVDYPVDNRLSKLEFAIAMHLIVCVSKKNLPMPNVFPPSLKALKDQELQPQQQPPSPQQQQQPHSMNVGAVSGPSGGEASFQPTSPPQPTLNNGLNMGGMSISDAFGNINITTNGPSAASSDATPTTAHHGHAASGGSGVPVPVNPTNQMVPQPQPTFIPPQQTQPLQNTFSGDGSIASTEELKSLHGVLQKLQAENVSLKAQLGQFSDEEMSVKKQINQTITEISTLSMELNTLRTQVTDAKSSLIEATSELKAQIEKRE